MKYSTIRIEGSILSADILDKISREELSGQTSKDFGLSTNSKVKDEIARAWADAQDMWRVYKRRIERLKEYDYGTSETRKFWVIPLLDMLGFDAGIARAVESSICLIGEGFLAHPDNGQLRVRITENKLNADDLYQYILKLIYRLLFLMVIEERDLVYPKGCDKKKRQVYYSWYSVASLRRLQLGLTKTYNLFHSKKLTIAMVEKASKQDETTATQAYEDILHLRKLHKEMDNAVLAAYGWTDIDLAHNFYDMDYLPENDSTRYTISPAARKEILKRLLQLNHDLHAEDVANGLHDKKKTPRKKAAIKPKVHPAQGKLF